MATGWHIDQRDRHIIALVFGIVVLSAVALGKFEISVFSAESYAANLLIYACVILLYSAFHALKITLIDRPDSLTKTIKSKVFGPVQRQKLWRAAPIIFCLVMFMPVFSALKSAVPLFNAYSWDAYFIDLDRQIHGDDVWKILQPIFGYPIVTAFLALLYHLWIVLVYAGSMFFAFYQKSGALRQQYLITYFLAWALIGAVLAMVFSSVGPCFLEPITGRDDFAPLMRYLHEANTHYPIMVLDVQQMLLSGYQDSDRGIGRGITAMPSMHVSMALLFFLAVRRISKTAAWLSGIFLVAILIGSVHLGYHYAVDGYVSLIATAIIWKFAGWWAARDACSVERTLDPQS